MRWIGLAAVCVTMVACAATPAGSESGELHALDGHVVAIEDVSSTASGGATEGRSTVDGQPLVVTYDGTLLRVTLGARSVALREARPGVVGMQLDDDAHGEHVTSTIAATTLSAEAALDAARGHLARSQAIREGVLAPVAERIIGSWDETRRASADALLASWVVSLRRDDAVATSAVSPKWIGGGEAIYAVEMSCDQGTSCSVSAGGYSCSVSCTQGYSWWGGANCASCLVYDGRTSCSCDR